MRIWRGTVALLLTAGLLAGCSRLPGFLGGEGRVGPKFEFGPVPTFADEAWEVANPAFYRTGDGWCTEFGGGMSCAGGTDTELPTGFTGFGGTWGPDETCIEAVTGNEVVRLEVVPADAPVVTLHPLGGSEAAPVNMFAACWRPAFPIDDITAEAFDADGESLGSGF